ncbi:Rh-like protein/ammonium transporter [Pleurostoma richardsiae]|uniref:Rh-like protein/ammonium transporter n=1 Tax=Pleurostoma richardsiae TaxID=41990 RepID=A0AA38VCU4_9PEZI|nr:Rh-like protein/ammonium transporter [Pleurostoma richardsiae]
MDRTVYTFNVSQAPYVEVDATIHDIEALPQRFYSGGDLAWVMVASVLVFLMVPGLSLFYSGILPPKVALQNAWLPLMTAAVIGIQWYLWGYAVTFSNWPDDTTFWGGAGGIALNDALLRPVPAFRNNGRDGPYVPEILYVLFEGMFASFTAALVAGAAAMKDRPGHFLIFIVLWATFVYDPIARWTWNLEGWSNKWGTLDFAGGSAVHICAGATVLAHCVFHKFILPKMEAAMGGIHPDPTHEIPMGQLNGQGNGMNGGLHGHHPPLADPVALVSDPISTDHTNVLLGTLFLWIGWFGFNGGSALSASVRAVSACVSTHLAACAGAVTHCALTAIVEFLSSDGDGEAAAPRVKPFRFSVVDFCNGAVIGLVAITPAAGFVPHSLAVVFGIIPTIICWALYGLSLLVDDKQFIVVIHGIGGFVGMLMTGFFARGSVAALDGTTLPHACRGGLDGHWIQLAIQFGDACAASGYAFVVSLAILVVLEPMMFYFRRRQTRTSEEVDDSQVIVECRP